MEMELAGITACGGQFPLSLQPISPWLSPFSWSCSVRGPLTDARKALFRIFAHVSVLVSATTYGAATQNALFGAVLGPGVLATGERLVAPGGSSPSAMTAAVTAPGPTPGKPAGRAPGLAAGTSAPGYFKMLTARATISATVTMEMTDCRAMASFAQRDSGITSVGLNADALVNAR